MSWKCVSDHQSCSFHTWERQAMRTASGTVRWDRSPNPKTRRLQLTQLAMDCVFEGNIMGFIFNSSQFEKQSKSLGLWSGFVIRGYHGPIRTLKSCLHCENRLRLYGDSRTEEMMTLARFCLPCELWLAKMRLISVYSVWFIFQTNFNSNLLALWSS